MTFHRRGTTSSVSVTSSPSFDSFVEPQDGQHAGAGMTTRSRGSAPGTACEMGACAEAVARRASWPRLSRPKAHLRRRRSPALRAEAPSAPGAAPCAPSERRKAPASASRSQALSERSPRPRSLSPYRPEPPRKAGPRARRGSSHARRQDRREECQAAWSQVEGIIVRWHLQKQTSANGSRPPSFLRIAPVDPGKQIAKLRRRNRDRAVSRARPQKPASLQTLRKKTCALAVMPDHLQQIAAASAKAKQMAAQRIAPQNLLNLAAASSVVLAALRERLTRTSAETHWKLSAMRLACLILRQVHQV